jgi:hypothetical protein
MTSDRTLRIAGYAAFAAALGYLLIPVFRAVVGTLTGAELSTYPKPSEIAANTWVGISGAVIFIGMGLAALILTQATASIRPDGFGTRLGAAAGIVAAIGFALAGASSAAMYSWIAGNLTETGANAGAQVAALWAVNVTSLAPLALAAVGMCGWAWWLLRSGIVGTALSVSVALIATVIAVGIIGFAFLPVQFLYLPLSGLLGIGLVRASRRAR